nr:hypothetical protein BaRGS_017001 [Batillaria attramentaria]
MQRGYLQQVRMLVDLGSNLESRDATGRTPLMLTAYVQPEEWGVGIARLLIETGVSMTSRDRYGMHVLHHACVYERLELAKVLLNALDFDMAQADKFGNTPLHYAAVSGNIPLVKLLLTYLLRYRLPLDKVNKQNRTALDEAVHAGNDVCAAIINAAINYSSGSGSAREDNLSVGKGDNDSVCESNAPFATSTEYSFSPQQEVSIKVLGAGEGESRSAFQKVDLLRQDFLLQHVEPKESSPPSTERSFQSRSRRTGVRRPHTAAVKRPSSAGSSSSGGSTSRLHNQSFLNGRSGSSTNIAAQNGRSGSYTNLAAQSRSGSYTNLAAQNGRNGSLTNIALSGVNITTDSANDTQTSSRRLSGRPSQGQRLRREGSSIVRSYSQQPLLPYEKNPDRVIHVASENDFRNTPEYVLKLTKMYFDPATFDTDSLPILVKQPTSVRYDDPVEKKTSGPPSWREEMRVLYRHYEIQCSPSWRNAAKPPLDPLTLLTSPSPAQGEEADEVGSAKDKKCRRPSSVKGPEASTSSAVKRRPTSTKQRKISATNPPSGPNRTAGASPDSGKGHAEGGMTDLGIASSNESLSSATSIKKKDSVGAKTETGQSGGAAAGGSGGCGGGGGGGGGAASSSSRSQAKTSLDNSNNGKGSGSDSGSVAGAGRGGGSGGSGGSGGGGQGGLSGAGGGGSTASNASNATGNATGSATAQARGRRTGTSSTYTVPVLTATMAAGDANANDVNGEPTEIDSNRLSVLSDIDEV